MNHQTRASAGFFVAFVYLYKVFLKLWPLEIVNGLPGGEHAVAFICYILGNIFIFAYLPRLLLRLFSFVSSAPERLCRAGKGREPR